MPESTPPPDASYDDPAPFTRTGIAGEIIFKEGDAESGLFIVKDGRVELLRDQAAMRVGVAEEGDLIGEWSFFEGQPCDLTARALTDVTLIRLDRQAFEHVTREAPETAIRMMQQLARALHERRAAAPMAAAPRRKMVTPPAPPAGPASLVEETSGTRFVLDAVESQVGRLDRESGNIPEIDLTPFDSDRTLSRQHAVIVRDESKYTIRDSRPSRNGTFVNGRRVEPGADSPLADGDEVRFGLVRTIFRWR